MKRLLPVLAAILILGAVAWVAQPARVPSTPRVVRKETAPEPKPTEVDVQAPTAVSPAPLSVKPRAWPPQERTMSASSAPRPPESRPAPQPASSGDVPEVAPPAPTLLELKEVAAWKKDDAQTPGRLQQLLLDPERPSPLKMVALEKLRTLGADLAAPVLVEFVLSESAAPDSASLKPTAVGLLADFAHPAADRALAEIAARSREASVQSTLFALSSRPKPPKSAVGVRK